MLAHMASPPPLQIDENTIYQVTLATDRGDILMELDPQLAPVTVNHFVVNARNGFYDGLTFHRVVPGFVIQGGDPEGTGRGGPGYRFDDEPFSGDYDRGALAMANAGPNTNGSQFFICHSDLRGRLPKQYTVFGRVLSGLEVVDAIATAPRDARDFPQNPVAMTKVTIEEA